MTELLQQAIAEVSKLPEMRQDKVASWLLEKLAFEDKLAPVLKSCAVKSTHWKAFCEFTHHSRLSQTLPAFVS